MANEIYDPRREMNKRQDMVFLRSYFKEVQATGRMNWLYTVTVRPDWMPGRDFVVKLRGGADMEEVLRLFWLQSGQRPEPGVNYVLAGWKSVQPCWGPTYAREACFLCEYEETELSFVLTGTGPRAAGSQGPVYAGGWREFTTLYGCPPSGLRLPERGDRPVGVLDLGG